jgi:2,5-dioxopentanoate dehydrogenase
MPHCWLTKFGVSESDMTISGKILVNGNWQKGQGGSFNAVNPTNGKNTETQFSKANAEQVEQAAAAAEQAFNIYRLTSLEERAQFLHTCADEIMALADELLDCVTAETGYPKGRGEGERARTCGQLRMQADFIKTGEYLDARIDPAMPDRQPLPRADIRYLNQPIGPIAVFAVSNFPLAYSTAGGDTASALAAGCSVIVKGHPSHPGTGELVAQALQKAASKCNMPNGLISFVHADDAIGGAALINAPQIKGIGFTGSIKGGTSIAKMAAARPEPIPVFAEMGSINPVILLPEALAQNYKNITTGFIASLTLGSGQFCVNPGLLVAIDNSALEQFVSQVAEDLKPVSAAVMLNERICQSFSEGTQAFANYDDVELVASGQVVSQQQGFYAQTQLFSTQASTFLANKQLQEEVFGPASLVVKCQNKQEIHAVIQALGGQLTATVHGLDSELEAYNALLNLLSLKVGRIVINGFPTGVEVCSAMVHGGPFPASTDSRFTSVGTAALLRWIRPVCYQSFPDKALPAALQNNNPLGLMRTIDGVKSRQTIN